jgi:ferredoxin
MADPVASPPPTAPSLRSVVVRARSSFPGRSDRVLPWGPEHRTGLEVLRAGGQPIASSCAGETVCGRCVVEVLAGGDELPPPEPDEAAVLAARGAAPGERLVCRIRRAQVHAELVLGTPYW